MPGGRGHNSRFPAAGPSLIDAVSHIPLIVGVTGHRDLVEAELPQIRRQVRRFFGDLQARYPDLPVRVLTGLAAGADSLVAEEARAAGCEVVNLLPMPVALYRTDFDASERADFEHLLKLAETLELPVRPGIDPALVARPGPERDLQYEQLGVFLAAHSHVLLALWDGRGGASVGGTGQVVAFHQYDTTVLGSRDQSRSQLDVADDESDLVYHIVCSRRRGPPEDGLEPGAAFWFSRDPEALRSDRLPPRYGAVFEHLARFNRDQRRLPSDHAAYPLTPEHPDSPHLAALADVQRVYGASDALAGRYQARTVGALRATLGAALLAGLCFIAYADFEDLQIMIWAYFACVAAALGVYRMASRGAWQSRYLDYRVLAESLRVQYYWVLAGVSMSNPSRYSHDSFFQGRDLQLGWIRNVMRATGLRTDQAHRTSSADIDQAIRHWVGDADSGQLGYYRRRAADKARQLRTTERVTLACFAMGLLAGLILALGLAPDSGPWNNLLVALMGLLPLIAAARQNYAHRLAERELVAQYNSMHGLFANAARLLDGTDDRLEQQQILRELGEAALQENAEWLLRQRDRPLPGSDAMN